MIYITGDTHGDMKRIINFCNVNETTGEDVLIILGDAGINYFSEDDGYGWIKQTQMKESLANLHTKIFCIHGNHERRPYNCPGYVESKWNGGTVWLNYNYPNIMFAKDGEVFDLGGLKTVVIGGAYSVDKWYRLSQGWSWFADEQPDAKIKADVKRALDENGWKFDVVLSHTVPYQYRPTDKFIPGLDQSTVDSTTERWLREIEMLLDYKKWYAGHYHIDRKVDKLQMMFESIEEFGV